MKVSQNICKKIAVFTLWGAFVVGNVAGSTQVNGQQALAEDSEEKIHKSHVAVLGHMIFIGKNVNSFLMSMENIDDISQAIADVISWQDLPKWWKNQDLTLTQKLIKLVITLAVSVDVDDLSEVMTLFSQGGFYKYLDGCLCKYNHATKVETFVFGLPHLEWQKKSLNNVVEEIFKKRPLDVGITEIFSEIQHLWNANREEIDKASKEKAIREKMLMGQAIEAQCYSKLFKTDYQPLTDASAKPISVLDLVGDDD